jgi:hypothetical protein
VDDESYLVSEYDKISIDLEVNVQTAITIVPDPSTDYGQTLFWGTGLPKDLRLNGVSGLITGEPLTSGEFEAELTLGNTCPWADEGTYKDTIQVTFVVKGCDDTVLLKSGEPCAELREVDYEEPPTSVPGARCSGSFNYNVRANGNMGVLTSDFLASFDSLEDETNLGNALCPTSRYQDWFRPQVNQTMLENQMSIHPCCRLHEHYN